MKFFVMILFSISLAACGASGDTLGAVGVGTISTQNGQPVYVVHSQTGKGCFSRNSCVYSGSKEFKAYKRLPVEKQKISDLVFRKNELDKLARKKCAGEYKVVQNYTPGRIISGGATFDTSKFHFVCM